MSSINSAVVKQDQISVDGSKIKMKSSLGAGMIEAMQETLSIKTKSWEDKVVKIDEKTAKFSELTSLVADLSKKADVLSQSDSIALSNNDVFQTFIASGGMEEKIVANVTGATRSKTFTFEVLQKASYDSRLSATAAADSLTALNLVGSITFKALDATVSDVVTDIVATDTIDSIITKVNRNTAIHGVSATKVPVAGGYKLEFAATNIATPLDYTTSITSGDSSLLPAIGTPSTSDSLSSLVKYNGNSLGYLQTNSIEIDGVTLDINNAVLNTPTTISVEQDLNTIKTKIQEFVESYNKAIDFIIDEKAVVVDEDGNERRGPLAGTLALQNFESGLKTLFNSLFNNLTTAQKDNLNLSAMAGDSVGVTYLGLMVDDKSKIIINETDINDALVNKLEDLKKVFQFTTDIKTGSPELQIITKPTNVFYGDVSLSMTKTGTTYTGQVTYNSVNYSVTQTVSNGIVTFKVDGATTDPLYGMEFFVDTNGLADGTYTADYNINYGITNNLKSLIDNINSQITTETDKLTEEKTKSNDKISDIKLKNESIIASYEDRISRMEATLAELKSMDTMLNMIFKNKSND